MRPVSPDLHLGQVNRRHLRGRIRAHIGGRQRTTLNSRSDSTDVGERLRTAYREPPFAGSNPSAPAPWISVSGPPHFTPSSCRGWATCLRGELAAPWAGANRLAGEAPQVFWPAPAVPSEGITTDLREFTASDLAAWRGWLEEHASNSEGVWLVPATKGTTQLSSRTYDQALEETFCSGWVEG